MGRCRHKSTHQSVALVVGIDADKTSVAARVQELDDELQKSGAEKRGTSDRVAIVAPKRNIETWFKHFQGDEVEEETDYKGQVKRPDYRQAAGAFVNEFHQYGNAPDEIDTLPALRAAYEEIRRILPG